MSSTILDPFRPLMMTPVIAAVVRDRRAATADGSAG
jgi:hypothetical protein